MRFQYLLLLTVLFAVAVAADDREAELAAIGEVIASEQNGRFRGTGVLVRQDNRWKIAHYAMSFLIFNEDWDAVIELTQQTQGRKADTAGND